MTLLQAQCNIVYQQLEKVTWIGRLIWGNSVIYQSVKDKKYDEKMEKYNLTDKEYEKILKIKIDNLLFIILYYFSLRNNCYS